MFINSGNRVIPVEFVGEEKISLRQAKTQAITDMCLKDSNIGIGYPRTADRTKHQSEVSSMCEALVHLDVARCLISRWDVIAEILTMTPVLETLRLDGNRLTGVTEADIDAFVAAAPKTLKDVYISQCGLTAADLALLARLPIAEIHLASNNFTDDDIQGMEFVENDGIRTLGLEDNGLTSWGAIARVITAMTGLTALSVAGNALPDVPIADIHLPASVTALNLSGTAINDWKTLEDLVETAVTTIRTGSEQMDDKDQTMALFASFTSPQARMLCVARLPFIKCLNGANISKMERADAEKAYVRSVMSQEVTEPLEAIKGRHPRIVELVEAHDLQGEFPAQFGGEHEKTSVDLTLRFVSLGEIVHTAPLNAMLSWSIAELVKMAAPPAGFTAVREGVKYIDSNNEREEGLDQDKLLLEDYRMDDGYVVEVPVVKRRARRRR